MWNKAGERQGRGGKRKGEKERDRCSQCAARHLERARGEREEGREGERAEECESGTGSRSPAEE